jgi:hypothetical protein
MTNQDFSLPPTHGFVLTLFLTVADVVRSADFYAQVLDGKIVRHGQPTILRVCKQLDHPECWRRSDR